MTIAIEDISKSDEMDRKALTAVRGGNMILSCPPPGEHGVNSLPELPSFPAGFPFIHGFPGLCPPEKDPEPKVIPI